MQNVTENAPFKTKGTNPTKMGRLIN